MSLTDDQRLYDDPKYRSYAAHIDKALKNFEYSTEWADLISALVKLNKVLQSNTSFNRLPKSITIGKRLSQCMHPALPGGVHIKALEIYDTVFKIIGKKGLEMDLHIYGSGIFSLLANATMQVRPVLLNVYETHLLPLGEKLRLSLDGLLLGLLPGIEEGSEHFDRITLLLDKISKSVGLQYFYSSLWRCVLCSPSGSSVRLSAAQLVLRQFDKKKMTDDQIYLIGLDVDVMTHALCAALQDNNVLTQRATLDILIFCFPLSSLPVSRSDVQQIMSSALNILLRRDMSLNRRLYSWLMGTDPSKSTSSEKSAGLHFENFSQEILTYAISDAISITISEFSSICCVVSMNALAGAEIRILRIIISLLDKADIGPVILNDVLQGLLQLIELVARKYKYILSENCLCGKCKMKSSDKEECENFQSEYVKLVNLFVNTFETDYIWHILGEKFVQSCVNGLQSESEPHLAGLSLSDVCSIVEVMLETVSIEALLEIPTIHLPELLNKVFLQLLLSCEDMSENDIARSLQLSMKILKHVQPSQSDSHSSNSNTSKPPILSCVESFQSFLAVFVSSKIVADKSEIQCFHDQVFHIDQGISTQNGLKVIASHQMSTKHDSNVCFKSHDTSNKVVLKAFQDACQLLIDLCCFPILSFPNDHHESQKDQNSNALPDWLVCLMACSCHKEVCTSIPEPSQDPDYNYGLRMASCYTVIELLAATKDHSSVIIKGENHHLVGSVVVPPPLSEDQIKFVFSRTDFVHCAGEILWQDLAEEASITCSSHKSWSIASILISLHELCSDDTIEKLMLQDLLCADQTTRVVAIKKFIKLWHYMKDGSKARSKKKNMSRCIFAILDQLTIDRYALFPHRMNSKSIDTGQSLASTTVSVWLRQLLDIGDISRILEPFIVITLEEKTHRKSLLHFLQCKDDNVSEGDQIENFIQIHKENMLDSSCQFCIEAQKNPGEYSWKFNDFSVDSSLTTALCEVHYQIAKEKHSYQNLIGLLTLSDDVNSFRSVLNSVEEDLDTWAAGFVQMIITQAVSTYQAELNEEKDIEDIPMADSEEEKDETSCASSVSQANEAIELNQSFMMNENPLYSHILIYQEEFDANCVLYGLKSILSIISNHPSVFVYAACTTSLASSESSYSSLVQELLVRHERSIEQGRSFYESTPPSLKGAMKNRMLIEVLISICLYYLRSAFQNGIKTHEMDMNHELHTIAAKLLKFILKELRNLAQHDAVSYKGPKVTSSTKQFSAYIVLVLQRQQVQSVALTCLLTTIFALKNHGRCLEDGRSVSNFSGIDISLNFDEEALHFSRSDDLVDHYLGSDLVHITTMFSHFLELVFEIVTLEHHAFHKDQKVQSRNEDENQSLATSASVGMSKKKFVKPILKRSHRLFSHLLSASHQYDSDLPLACQKVFVSTILEIYRLDNQPTLHIECSVGLSTVMPYFGTALSATVLPVLLQQCLNLENITKIIAQGSLPSIPPSYIENTIGSLVKLCHYCLLSDSTSGTEKQSSDASQSDSISLISAKTSQFSASSSIGAGLSTLLNVFSTSNSSKTASAATSDNDKSDGLFAAKIAILNNLARVVSCMCVLWRDVVGAESEQFLSNEELKGVSYTILQLLGPLAMRYGEYLLVAFSLVWQDREMEKSDGKEGTFSPLISFTNSNPNLEHIIDLMMAIKLLSTEMYFSLVKQVIRDPPPTTNEHKDVTLHESLLQMLLFYMRRMKPGALLDNWNGFLAVVQESLSLGLTQSNQSSTNTENVLSPSCHFLLMYLLSEYVKRSSAFSGKKEQKELQDIVIKCVEACNTIAGSSLEQGTWIRRNVSVLPGPQAPESALKTHRKTESQSSLDLTDITLETTTESHMHLSSSDSTIVAQNQNTLPQVKELDESRSDLVKERPTTLPQISKPSLNSVNFRNSVKALSVLSEVVANLLDVVYSSDEKEKIVPILISIMANVTPYLRNHNKDNTPSFTACVSFLSSISGFQYTRRAWRKEVIDLFLDGMFFHMPYECIAEWRNIIDNLLTHDKLTFKEIMSRTGLSKPGAGTPTLNIFSNKEQELELRALHIKRLAFIVFSSESDQYQRQLPEIQERLAESLRLSNVPGVQCRVFLCFRVLLLRISSNSLTSLWPTIFTELVHSMMQLEQALKPSYLDDEKKTKLKNKSGKTVSQSSGDGKTVMTCWYDMYLASCKLLDLALCLPTENVPQFQLYKWSFIGDVVPYNQESKHTNNFHLNSSVMPTLTLSVENIEDQNEKSFVPHCVRIQQLFSDLFPARKNRILQIVPEKPLLNITRLKSLEQLQPFFNTITSPAYLLNMQYRTLSLKPTSRIDSIFESKRTFPLVERTLERDFMRQML